MTFLWICWGTALVLAVIGLAILRWWPRYNTCSQCGKRFKRHPNRFPSLVGAQYCSVTCEQIVWDRWAHS